MSAEDKMPSPMPAVVERRKRVIRSVLIGAGLCLATTFAIQVHRANVWQEQHDAAEEEAHQAVLMKTFERIHRQALADGEASRVRKATLDQCLAEGHDRDGCRAAFMASFPVSVQGKHTQIQINP